MPVCSGSNVQGVALPKSGYLVLCSGDLRSDGARTHYVSRTSFSTYDAAYRYALTAPPTRNPVIVAMEEIHRLLESWAEPRPLFHNLFSTSQPTKETP
jgi:hypothetical protein